MMRTLFLAGIALSWAGLATAAEPRPVSAWAWVHTLGLRPDKLAKAERMDADLAWSYLAVEGDPFVRAALLANVGRQGRDRDAVPMLAEMVRDGRLSQTARLSAALRLADLPGGHVAAGDILRLPEQGWGSDLVVDILAHFGRASVSALRPELTESSPIARFELACRVLERLGPLASAAEPELVALLHTPQREHHARDALVAVTRPPTLEHVLAGWTPEGSGELPTRTTTNLWCLGLVHHPHSRQQLDRVRRLYQDETNLLDRCALAAVLVKADKDAEALAMLRRVLRDGRERDLFRRDTGTQQARALAGYWLGELRVAEAAPDLLRLTDDQPQVAVLALRKLGSRALPFLRTSLSPETPAGRLFEVCRLVADSGPDAEIVLPELVALALHPDTRRLALRALQGKGTPRAKVEAELMNRFANAASPDERFHSLDALNVIASRGARASRMPELLAATRKALTPDELAELTADVVEVYPELLRSHLLRQAFVDTPVRRDLAWRAIGQIAKRQPGILDELAGPLDRADDDTRALARRILGEKVVPIRVVDPESLTELNSDDATVRSRAAVRILKEPADVLMKLKPAQRRHILALLEDKTANTRFSATVAASWFPADEAVPALRRALGDGSAKVRYAAAFALARHGQAAKPAIAELKKATEDEDETVRNRAIETLRLLTDDQ